VNHQRWVLLERSSGALARFFPHAGLFQEGERTLTSAREQFQARIAALDVGPLAHLALCETSIILSDLLAEQARVREALEVAREAVALAQKAESRHLEGVAHLQVGRTLYRLGEYGQGRVALEQAEALARTTHQPRLEAEALTLHGNIALDQGRYTEAHRFYSEALTLYRAQADTMGTAGALCNLGTNACMLGDYQQALTFGLEALAIRRTVGDERELAMSLEALGNLYYWTGEYATAQPYLEEALELYRRAGALLGVAFALTSLGHILIGRGELGQAVQAYEEALRIRQGANQHYLLPEDWSGLAQVALLRGDLSAAAAWVEAILASLKKEPIKSEDPFQIYLTCYRVLQAIGDCRAHFVLDQGYALLAEQARAIEEPTLRHAFLYNVTTHRELVEAWEARTRE
jgi:tetratricopeptide (TPR) repeat protein